MAAVDPAAETAGVRPGLTLADARALCPTLEARPADPVGDARALGRLADWCGRYSPWTGTDGADGVVLDITGCAHLFGGEAALAEDLVGRLARRGVAARAAVADGPGAAWAMARYGAGPGPHVVAPGGNRAALAGLPVAALRLPPDIAAGLVRLGLRHIGDLRGVPRAALAARFGETVTRRLDRALNDAFEPLSPRRHRPRLAVRLAWPDPIGHADDIARAGRRLVDRLCAMLAEGREGVRRLDLALYRVDGEVARVHVGTSRASRDPDHLMRLLAERLAGVEAGFGIETMVLSALAVEPLAAVQVRLGLGGGTAADTAAALAPLVDRLRNRLGPGSVFRLAPHASHLPERAVSLVPAATTPAAREWGETPPRPLRLLPCPEPIEVVAPLPDDPPVLFRWRRVGHRVRRADGPERIAPEWWRERAPTRDYYRLEDEDGRRFWVYRSGLYRDGSEEGEEGEDARPRWYMHGLFA